MSSLIINGQPVDSTMLAGINAVFSGVGLAISLVLLVLLIVAYWKMFTKAGEKGWKSIIPIYHEYVAFRLAWKDGAKNFWIWFIAAVVIGILSATTTVNGVTTTLAGDNVFLNLIVFAAVIITFIWYIRFLVKQAHAYNKGTGCAVLALFFPNIMTLFYGFASTATYQGPQD